MEGRLYDVFQCRHRHITPQQLYRGLDGMENLWDKKA